MVLTAVRDLSRAVKSGWQLNAVGDEAVGVNTIPCRYWLSSKYRREYGPRKYMQLRESSWPGSLPLSIPNFSSAFMRPPPPLDALCLSLDHWWGWILWLHRCCCELIPSRDCEAQQPVSIGFVLSSHECVGHYDRIGVTWPGIPPPFVSMFFTTSRKRKSNVFFFFSTLFMIFLLACFSCAWNLNNIRSWLKIL